MEFIDAMSWFDERYMSLTNFYFSTKFEDVEPAQLKFDYLVPWKIFLETDLPFTI